MYLLESGRQIFVSSVILIALATISVALRIWARKGTGQSFGLADIFITLALILYAAYNGVLLYFVVNIAGTFEQTELSPPQMSQALQIGYALEILFIFIITFLKLSILSWYRIIFVVPAARRAIIVVAALCCLWMLLFLFLTIFQCTPIAAVWDLELAFTTAKCIPFGSLLFGYEFTNIILDLAILSLPIHMITKLQMPLRRKIALSFIFFLGGFVVVSSILRIVYLYNPKDSLRVSLPLGLLWSTIELGAAIICANLPLYRALFKSSGLFSQAFSRIYSSLLGSRRTKSDSSPTDVVTTYKGGWDRTNHHGDQPDYYKSRIEPRGESSLSTTEDAYPLRPIRP